MANFLLSYRNLVDQPDAVLTASHESPGLPAANLRDPDILRVWRSIGSTAPQLRVDFGAANAVRVLGLFGLARLDPSDTIRWRLGNSAGAGDVYDSTAIPCGRFPGYAQSVHCLEEALTARHLTVDLDAPSQAGRGSIDAGRLWAGDAWQGLRNWSFGATDDIDDGSTQQTDAPKAPATSNFIEPVAPGRVKTLTFEGISPAEKYVVMEIKMYVGRKRQVVFVPNPDDPEIQREALLGLIRESEGIRHASLPTRETSFTLRGGVLEEV